jgi:hypothetical protein
MTTPTYLKVLSADNQACHRGSYDYTPHLPTADGPGLVLPELGRTEDDEATEERCRYCDGPVLIEGLGLCSSCNTGQDS